MHDACIQLTVLQRCVATLGIYSCDRLSATSKHQCYCKQTVTHCDASVHGKFAALHLWYKTLTHLIHTRIAAITKLLVLPLTCKYVLCVESVWVAFCHTTGIASYLQACTACCNSVGGNAGTPEYVAPEVLSNESYDGKAADVWSCGVVLYTLLTGRFPFREASEDDLNPVLLLQRMFPRILSGVFKMPSNISPECRDLLAAMIQVDPAKRIPAIHILQHPWLAGSTSKAQLAALQRDASKPLSDSWAAQTDQQILRFTQEAAKGPAKNHYTKSFEALPF